MAKTDKDKTRIPACIGTLLFAGLVVLILNLCGLKFPIPPPAEYGVEVNLGYSDVGLGEEAVSENSESSSQPAASAEEEESIITSNLDDAPVLAVKPKAVVKKTSKVVENAVKTESKTDVTTPVQPKINSQALYTGKRNNNRGTSSSQGIKEGDGDMGKPDGTLRSNVYEGGGSGGGISFSLTGRTLMSLTKPEYNSDEQGIVVVKIWVNRQGIVVRTQVGIQGTTTMDEQLWATAKKAAVSSKFVPKDNAPEEQVGTISYKFVIGQ